MFSEGLESFLDYIRDCQQQYNMFLADQEEAEAVTQDLLHSLELDENDDDVMLIISKVMKSTRADRRTAKKQIAALLPIVDWSNNNKKVLNDLRMVLGIVRKEEQRAPRRTYAPRTDVVANLKKYIDEITITNTPDVTEINTEAEASVDKTFIDEEAAINEDSN